MLVSSVRCECRIDPSKRRQCWCESNICADSKQGHPDRQHSDVGVYHSSRLKALTCHGRRKLRTAMIVARIQHMREARERRIYHGVREVYAYAARAHFVGLFCISVEYRPCSTGRIFVLLHSCWPVKYRAQRHFSWLRCWIVLLANV